MNASSQKGRFAVIQTALFRMLFTKLSSFYFFYFSLLGLLAPYLGLFLESRGFSLLEIAQLTSILMLTKVLAPNIWGAIADRTQKRLMLVRLGALVALISYIGFFFAETFWHYAVAIVVFSFFWNAVLPQFEVITLFNLAHARDKYSRVRLWGSIGFICSVVIAGATFDRFGIGGFPWALLLVIACIGLSSLFRLGEPRSNGERAHSSSFWSLIRRPGVLLFFMVCFLLQLSHGPYYTYFSIYMEQIGYGKTKIGLLWSLGVWAEVVLFVFMHLWFRRMTVTGIMIAALILTAVRWFLIAHFADDLMLLIFAQCLHAMSFGAMHAAAIHYVHQTFPLESQGRAQALYSSMGFGAGGAAGAYLSGLVVDFGGYSLAFELSGGVAALAVVLLCVQRFVSGSR